MLNIKKILLPLDFPNTWLPVIHQAATLARRFHSEIVALHVVSEESRAAGVPEINSFALTHWDMVAEIVKRARRREDQSLEAELKGLAIRPLLANGDPARAIVDAARAQEADLIMLPSGGYTFTRFLLGSESAKARNGVECPVWTGAHVEQSSSLVSQSASGQSMSGQSTPGQSTTSSSLSLSLSSAQKFDVRNVLCAIDFTPHSEITVSWAANIAGEFDAGLTLAHATPEVGIWSAGGTYVNPKLKAELVEDAGRQMAELQQSIDIKAKVFIGSGDVPTVLSQAASQTKADLLVNECYPYGGNLRLHGFGVIRAVPIPVLSV
jgi:nucleotide-binding universal stress UspA family protein